MAALDWGTIGDEAVVRLKDLLRIDTTNPPGNERPAADYLAGILEQEGIEVEIFESEPTRANLVLTQERWPEVRFVATREH